MRIIKVITWCATFLIMLSCGQNTLKEIKYKQVSALDGSYIAEIPSYLSERRIGTLVSFSSEKPQMFGCINKISEEDFKKNVEKTSEQNGYVYKKIEYSDSTVFYKVSKGMFSAYELYFLKRLNNNEMYVINLSSFSCSKNELVNIINHISASFKYIGKKSDLSESSVLQSQTLIKFETYSTDLYSIKYPKGWKIVENINAMTDVYIGSEIEEFGFTIVRFPTDESLSTIAREGNEQLKNAGAKILKSQMIKVGRHTCHKSETEVNVSGIIAKHISFTFKEKGMLYNVRFGNISNSKRSKVCEEIIKTLIIK